MERICQHHHAALALACVSLHSCPCGWLVTKVRLASCRRASTAKHALVWGCNLKPCARASILKPAFCKSIYLNSNGDSRLFGRAHLASIAHQFGFVLCTKPNDTTRVHVKVSAFDEFEMRHYAASSVRLAVRQTKRLLRTLSHHKSGGYCGSRQAAAAPSANFCLQSFTGASPGKMMMMRLFSQSCVLNARWLFKCCDGSRCLQAPSAANALSFNTDWYSCQVMN